MCDLISRQAALNILDAYQVMIENGEEKPYAWARLQMSKLPSVEPKQKAKKATWIDMGKNPATGEFDTEMHIMCSECGYRSDNKPTRFCPHCGADMKGEQE